MFALAELEAVDRELAGRLLRVRSGPPPWDLREAPANRRFLDGMRAAGIDPEPWLDTTSREVRVGAGDRIDLALCADPLEVFEMGAHFDTCLSPDAFNYFSVVANAADINKRVLYARRGERVVGRCLLALTDAFAIVTFNPYCHERIDFPAIVRDFATELAARMRTVVVAGGPVRTLLAREWYDDGARDLVGRFSGLGANFEFDTVAPEQLVARLRELLGRDLDAVTLPLVINHRGLRGRPRHLMPLVPFVLASEVSQLRIEAAQLALDAGEPALARRLLGDHGHAIDLRYNAWPRGEMLAQLSPSETLARIRRTRARGVRRWRDESADRIAVAGVALETLARPRKAAAMYRLAITNGTYLEDPMTRRLEALGAPLDGELAE